MRTIDDLSLWTVPPDDRNQRGNYEVEALNYSHTYRYKLTLRIIDNHHVSLDGTRSVGDSTFALAIGLPVFVVVPLRPSFEELLFVTVDTRVVRRNSLKYVVELPLRNVENCRVS